MQLCRRTQSWKGRRTLAALVLAAGTFLVLHPAFSLQAPAPNSGAATVRVVGTVTAVDGITITVKSDAGAEQKISIQETTRMLQTAPGQTTLTGATAIRVQDLQAGDRISVRGTMAEDGKSFQATSLIAMKQADLQKKQEADREDWRRRGVFGVVKSVDSTSGMVTVTTGAGTVAKTLIIQVAKTTVIRRYARDSAKLSDARPATLDQVKAGDELQARGTRGAGGNEFAAEEIVMGSFRNLAGAITAIDTAAETIALTDLATKKPYVIRCTAESQLRKLPPMMAQMLAARLKGPGAVGTASAEAAGGDASHGSTSAGGPGSNGPRGSSGGGGMGGGGMGGDNRGGQGATAGSSPNSGSITPRQPGGGDPQQMLSHAPAIRLSDLQKGDVVMVVATEGLPGSDSSASAPGAAKTVATSSTAITLIAGVEPMLRASASASQSLLSSSWSLGSGAPGGESGQ